MNTLRLRVAAVATAKSPAQARAALGRLSIAVRQAGTVAAQAELDRARAELRRRGWL